MAAESPNDPVALSAVARSGPVGRLVRLLLAVAGGWFAFHLFTHRGFVFAHGGWDLLVLTVLAVYGVYHTAAIFDRGKLALASLAVAAVAATGLAIVRAGSVWAPPLSWLVWGVDLGFLVMVSVLMLVATVVGTPGCELGVVSDLRFRLRRRTHQAEAMFCVVGLHKLDAWEARRAWCRH